jgi:Flp pilus assembly protein TadD
LRGESRKAAHASVAGRAEFLHALQLDPDEPDATAGLGIYNYFVDSLSGAVKILRFFMGIPGGSKEEGLRQMKIGIERGALMKVDTQFYLARNLRTFDHKYEAAASFAEPLAARYPRNPVFLLLAGNVNAELGRREKAGAYFRSALDVAISDPDCAARVRQVANALLASGR